MSEETMPTAEAMPVAATDDEHASYELAFHVLPTVVEGEVPAVHEAVKQAITDAGAEIIDEEAPERFDLAYEIIKYIEGKHRRFTSAYFGWVRFTAEPSAVQSITAAMEEQREILRHLLIRLTKEEVANPFRFHEALAAQKQVTDVEETDVPAEAADGATDDEGAEADDAEASDERADAAEDDNAEEQKSGA